MSSVITNQEKTLRSLEQSFKQQTIMVNKWKNIADLMDDLQSEPPQEDQEQQHHHDIERQDCQRVLF
ncbi:hypothetical protein LCAUCD174_2944 [Lacticaseibacillus paracasei]|nr:hypothetical protein LCAUCD174_2944 [Lacticaseibacillus paracasei]